MNPDDPKWKDSGYSPEKAWGEINRKEWEAANPVTARDRTKLGIQLALIVVCALVVVGSALAFIGRHFG